MKRRPVTGVLLFLTAIFIANWQRGGIVGHLIGPALISLFGLFGTALIVVGSAIAGLVLSGAMAFAWMVGERLGGWLATLTWRRQVRRAPKVAPRPLATTPLPQGDLRGRSRSVIEKEVRFGLKSLGYSSVEVEMAMESLDLNVLSTEAALRKGISVLRKAN